MSSGAGKAPRIASSAESAPTWPCSMSVIDLLGVVIRGPRCTPPEVVGRDVKLLFAAHRSWRRVGHGEPPFRLKAPRVQLRAL